MKIKKLGALLVSAALCAGMATPAFAFEGEGLLFFGNVILPFVDRFPTDLELYRIMTTKLGEVSEGAQK